MLEVLCGEGFSHEKVITKERRDYFLLPSHKALIPIPAASAAAPGKFQKFEYQPPSQVFKSETLGLRPSNLCINISSTIFIMIHSKIWSPLKIWEHPSLVIVKIKFTKNFKGYKVSG